MAKNDRFRWSFAQTFEKSAAQTITAMDAAGKDIPDQRPVIPLRLRRVGVTRRSIPVRIDDPLGGAQTVELSCAIEASVGLAPERRGIHVSRIGDLLARLTGEVYPSLRHYAHRVDQLLRAGQGSDTASVAVRGVFTYLESVRGVKDKSSLEHVELSGASETEGGVTTLTQGVGFTYITSCPCVQETYRNSFRADDKMLQRVLEEKRMPLLTHTQRCQTHVMIVGAREPLPLPSLLACVDHVVVRSQNTLPREFELLNVYRAHAKPQFLEDALRELTYGVYKLVGRDNPNVTLRIRSSSMESIHDFDMEGDVEFTVAELDRIFADT